MSVTVPPPCLFFPQRALASRELTEERLAPRCRGVPGYGGERGPRIRERGLRPSPEGAGDRAVRAGSGDPGAVGVVAAGHPRAVRCGEVAVGRRGPVAVAVGD